MLNFMMRDVLREQAPEPGGGNPNPAPPAFDPAAFQATLLSEIDKRVNGLDKRYDKRLKDFEASLKPSAPEPTPEPQPEPKPGQPDLEKIAMQKRVATLEKLVEEGNLKTERSEKAREETDRHSQIRTKLAAMKLADEAALNAGFKIFKDEVIRSEDGSLVAGQDAEPFDKYIERQVSTVYAFLLPAKQVNGAGAARNGSGQKAAIDLDDIKPGMTAEQRKLIQQEMSRVLASG